MPTTISQLRPPFGIPRSTEIVVIGAGIIGVSAVLTLAERGVPAVLVEKGVIAGEQSSRNWGWCRQQGRDPRELPLVRESLHLWRGMNQRVRAETGFRECGIAHLARTPSDLAVHEEWLDLARTYQVDSCLLSKRQLERLLPGCDTHFSGALYTASDGRAEPSLAVAAIAEAAQQHGAIVMENTAARGIETRGGAISSVITERGRIDCNAVIVAGGAWSRLFCRSFGIDVPQLKVVSPVLRTYPLHNGPEISVSGRGFAFRKRLDGGYTVAHGGVINYDIVPDSFRLLGQFFPLAWNARQELRPRLSGRFKVEWQEPKSWPLDALSPFEKTRILNPAPLPRVLHSAVENLGKAYPFFKSLRVAENWAGVIDVTPDAIPIISDVVGIQGLVLATGFSGHGFGIGPAAGNLAASLAVSDKLSVDITPFTLGRFYDGSKIQPIAGI